MSGRDDDFARLFPDATRIAAVASPVSRRPLTGSPPRAPKLTRLAKANFLIARERTIGTDRTDEDIYAEVGFRNADEYWSDATSEPMELSKFVHMTSIHFSNPSLEGAGDWYKLVLQDALRSALENSEPWIKNVEGKVIVEPREAAKYLLERPKREHLVPPGLRAFIKSPTSSAADQTPRPTKPRRQRRQTDRIVEAMMLMSLEELQSLKQKAMKDRFGAARSTCAEAKKEVLSIKSRATKSTIDS